MVDGVGGDGVDGDRDGSGDGDEVGMEIVMIVAVVEMGRGWR